MNSSPYGLLFRVYIQRIHQPNQGLRAAIVAIWFLVYRILSRSKFYGTELRLNTTDC
ncbi:hypothetical protein EX30DRAFT_137242 [Ascodesmis nigricans]|uniref:Uncharacterized protein n=1 Tax=Ascodesmis nigricans TaxID=341454 RepID=A0A4S2N0M2_9PEZI|nr:hypothetical protein EX30DRAFT_137242 [Ascodesmis nigricans]